MSDPIAPSEENALKRLVETGEFLDEAVSFSLPGGAPLFLAGEPADFFFWLRTGRLAVLHASADYDGRLIGVIKPGEPVGEMALIAGEAHTADVIALRDCEVWALSRDAFFSAAHKHPAFMTSLAQLMLRRIRPLPHVAAPAQPSVFGLCAVQAELDVRGLAESVAVILRAGGYRVIVFGSEARKSSADWFSDAERSNDYVLYVAQPDDSDWIALIGRQVDRIFRVANGAAPPPPDLQAVPGDTPYSQRLTDLILLQAADCQIPRGSPEWSAAVAPDRLFHIRPGHAGDLERLARVVTGRAVGLVLSGGAARAYAHVGAVRVLRAAKVPIDFVAGVSMGAVIGAGVAMGWDDQELDRRIRKSFVDSNPVDDIAFPFIAMTRGGKVRARLAEHFGEQQISDMWLPFFCLSANLTTGKHQIHRSGRLRDALAASGALPGVLPPALRDSDVLVDGAVLNNFPADIMRQIHSGLVIGVDVSRGRSVTAADITIMSVWRWFLSGEWRKGPPIVSILMRAATLSTTRDLMAAREATDLLILPMVDHIEVRDWKAYDEAVDAGISAAKGALAKLSAPFTALHRP